MRIILAALIVAIGSSVAAAQSTTATTGNTQPLATSPSSETLPNGRPKVKIPPAARSGKKGLRVGERAMDAGPVEVKRLK
jgi:hypothetical protein